LEENMKRNARFLLKAGKYFIGDPLHVMGLEAERKAFRETGDALDRCPWARSLNETKLFESAYWEDGKIALTFDALEGVYTDFGREYHVNNGMIAAVSFGLVKAEQKDYSKLGHVATFKKDFECADFGGLLGFGNILINTRYWERYYDFTKPPKESTAVVDA
jgi:hypothetical protein